MVIFVELLIFLSVAFWIVGLGLRVAGVGPRRGKFATRPALAPETAGSSVRPDDLAVRPTVGIGVTSLSGA